MRASSIVFVSIAFFIVMASLFETSDGFVVSLTARKQQLKLTKRKERLEKERMEKRLRKLLNKRTKVDKKLNHLREWIKKYKTKQKSKVSFSTLEFAISNNSYLVH